MKVQDLTFFINEDLYRVSYKRECDTDSEESKIQSVYIFASSVEEALRLFPAVHAVQRAYYSANVISVMFNKYDLPKEEISKEQQKVAIDSIRTIETIITTRNPNEESFAMIFRKKS